MNLDEQDVVGGDGFWEDFRNGCPKAFSKVYQIFRRPLIKYIQFRVRDRQAAEDIAQEVFLKAFRFRKLYEPGRALSSWLWTIARNATSDWLRRHRREAPASEWTEPACQAPNAETVLAAEFERRRLREAMSKLTELQRKVLSLRLVHHLSYAEISRRLGMTVSAAKCVAYRAKLALEELSATGAAAAPA